MKGQIYAVASGLLATLAGLFGKFAVSKSEAQNLCESFLLFLENERSSINEFCLYYCMCMRICCFAVMIIVNCMMWTTFTKALRFSSTSLEATITNTAANFFFTAIIGQVLFDEVIQALWWMGTIFIICGLLLLSHQNSSIQHNQQRSHSKML